MLVWAAASSDSEASIYVCRVLLPDRWSRAVRRVSHGCFVYSAPREQPSPGARAEVSARLWRAIACSPNELSPTRRCRMPLCPPRSSPCTIRMVVASGCFASRADTQSVASTLVRVGDSGSGHRVAMTVVIHPLFVRKGIASLTDVRAHAAG